MYTIWFRAYVLGIEVIHFTKWIAVAAGTPLFAFDKAVVFLQQSQTLYLHLYTVCTAAKNTFCLPPHSFSFSLSFSFPWSLC